MMTGPLKILCIDGIVGINIFKGSSTHFNAEVLA